MNLISAATGADDAAAEEESLPIHTTKFPQRLARWLAFTALFSLAVYVAAGRLDLPMLNAYVATTAALFLAGTLVVDPELLKERMRRGQKGEDPLRLVVIKVLSFASLLVALLDIGRFHWSDTVPRALQVASLAVMAVSMAWTFWAVATNRFFIQVIRIQGERGHRVVSEGPYARVRHPGYAGNAVTGPAGALALGSWWSLVPALAVSLLFVARAADEDRFLKEHLEGYREYAARVRFRLVPGLW